MFSNFFFLQEQRTTTSAPCFTGVQTVLELKSFSSWWK